MMIHKRLAVGLFTAVALASCSFSPNAQEGYNRIKTDIKSSMLVPSSYKGENVECYWDVRAFSYPYQYKITFSVENAVGLRVSHTRYYGYNDGDGSLENFGSDSSYFVTASQRGEKRSVIA